MGMYGGFEYQLLDKGDRNSDELFTQAQSLIRVASGDPAFSSIYTSFTSSLPQVVVNIEEEKAMAQGVPISEIYTTLAAQYGSTYVNDFNKYGRIYRVYMQADAPYREKLSDMSKTYVKNVQGRMVPLSSVITTKDIVGPYSLTRFNMYPAITINGNPASGVSSGTAMNEKWLRFRMKHCQKIWIMLGLEHHCKNRNHQVKSDQFWQWL